MIVGRLPVQDTEALEQDEEVLLVGLWYRIWKEITYILVKD